MTSLKEFAITEWNNTGINFWNISKCAGTSIKHALSFNEGFLDKINTSRDKSIHNNKFIKYIFREDAKTNGNANVAVIRHPVDRVSSLYRDFSLKRKEAIPVYGRNADISKIDNIDYFIKFYIEDGSDKDNIHLRSMSWSLFDNNTLLVDKIYNFENVKDFFNDFNLEYTFRNKSAEANINFTKEQIKIIQDRYRNDYENFGFSYE